MANMLEILRPAPFTPGYKGRWGLPLLLHGSPGIGKSSIIESVLGGAGLYVETILASIREPQDFLGFPIPVDGVMRYAAAEWTERVSQVGSAVVNLDEINTAPPAVQAALLRLVLDGVCGDVVLPHVVRFIAAQNSTEEAAGGWDLAPPLANRFGHLDWVAPTVDAWTDWLLDADQFEQPAKGAAATLEEAVTRAWGPAWARARGKAAGFLKRTPTNLFRMPDVNSPQASKAWPSPRSWEAAARTLAASEIHQLTEDERYHFMGAFIGDAVVMEFAEWETKADLPDPEELLDGKVKWTHNPRRLDITAAVLTSWGALIIPAIAAHREARAAKYWELVLPICHDAPDIAVPSVRKVSKAKGKKLTRISKTARKVLTEMQPVLAVAHNAIRSR